MESKEELQLMLDDIDKQIDFCYHRRYNIEKQLEQIDLQSISAMADVWGIKPDAKYVLVAKVQDYHYQMMVFWNVLSVDQDRKEFNCVESECRSDDGDVSFHSRRKSISFRYLQDVEKEFNIYKVTTELFSTTLQDILGCYYTWHDVQVLESELSLNSLLAIKVGIC